MPKVLIDGKWYRKRRNKLVPIPDVWVGQTTYEQTKRRRRNGGKWAVEGKYVPGESRKSEIIHYHGRKEDDE